MWRYRGNTHVIFNAMLGGEMRNIPSQTKTKKTPSKPLQSHIGATHLSGRTFSDSLTKMGSFHHGNKHYCVDTFWGKMFFFCSWCKAKLKEKNTFSCPSSAAWLSRWRHAPLYCPFTAQKWAAQLLLNVYSLGNRLHPVKVTPSCRFRQFSHRPSFSRVHTLTQITSTLPFSFAPYIWAASPGCVDNSKNAAL